MPQPHSMINKRPGQETRGITFGFFPESYKFWDLVPRQLHLAHSALNTLLTLHTSPLCPTSCLLPVLFPLLRRPCSQPSACPHISSIMSQLTCDLFGGAALVNTLPSTPSFPSAHHPFCSFHSTYQHPNSLYLSFCLHHPALKSKMAGGGHCLWNTGKYLFNEFLSHN